VRIQALGQNQFVHIPWPASHTKLVNEAGTIQVEGAGPAGTQKAHKIGTSADQITVNCD